MRYCKTASVQIVLRNSDGQRYNAAQPDQRRLTQVKQGRTGHDLTGRPLAVCSLPVTSLNANRTMSLCSVIVIVMLAPLQGVLAPDARGQHQVPKPFICMYGHSDDEGVTEAFRKLIPRINVIEGTSSNASFIQELRGQDCIYAAHVTNPVSATAEELVALWRAPFENELGGQLPGGYDAIAIDELRANPDGSEQAERVCRALAQLRRLYPRKQVYAAATWHLGYEAARYTQQLRAVQRYVDILMLEAYLRETRPAYGYFARQSNRVCSTRLSTDWGLPSKVTCTTTVPQSGCSAISTGSSLRFAPMPTRPACPELCTGSTIAARRVSRPNTWRGSPITTITKRARTGLERGTRGNLFPTRSLNNLTVGNWRRVTVDAWHCSPIPRLTVCSPIMMTMAGRRTANRD